MDFDFPSDPVTDQTYSPAGGATYTWNGYAWVVYNVDDVGGVLLWNGREGVVVMTPEDVEGTGVLDPYALLTDVTDALANKADISYVDGKDNAQDVLIGQKADKSYVDSANNTQDLVIAQKATTTYVDTAVANKADKSYVDSQDALKASIAYVDAQDIQLQTSINAKADKTYVDSQDTAQNTAINSKEPLIAAGTITQYWRGDKTWAEMPATGVSGDYLPLTGGTVTGDIIAHNFNLDADRGLRSVGAYNTQIHFDYNDYLDFDKLNNRWNFRVSNTDILKLFSDGKITTFGNITIVEPTTAVHAASKGYVDAKTAAAAGGAIISDTAPASPVAGQLWWESDTGLLLVYYIDADTGQWVATGMGPIGPPGPKGDKGDPGVKGDPGPAGSGGMDQATADARYVNVTGDTVTGTLNVGSAVNVGTVIAPDSIQIGQGLTGDRYTYIDFASDDTYPDFGLRIARGAGANANSELTHYGTGSLRLFGASGPVDIYAGSVRYVNFAGATSFFERKIISTDPTAHATSGDANSALEVRSNGGTGDGMMAAIGYHCVGQYAVKTYLRADGFWGIGGWSKSAWCAYLDAGNSWWVSGNVVAYSDPRLKDNVERIEDAYSIIENMHGYRFTWNDRSQLIREKIGKRDIGIMANEVKPVLPEIVTQSIEDETTGEIYDGVDYARLVPVLLEVIHDLRARIVALEAR